MKGSFNYYAFLYDDLPLGKLDQDQLCNGSCIEMIQKHIQIYWSSYTIGMKKNNSYETSLGFRICEEKDISKKDYQSGLLFVCPPNSGLEMKNAFSDILNNRLMSFNLKQKSKN